MKNIYEKISEGHLFQSVITGKGPDYSSKTYSGIYDSQNYYNKNVPMSKLRYSVLFNTIGMFDSVTDFGYGNGAFMNFCKDQGKKTYGYDISEYSVPEGCTRLNHWNDVSVDVMTFFDSLEHINERNLVPFLKSLNTKYVCVSLPWCHMEMGDDWFHNWKHRKENEHIHHFDSYGLMSLLKESNYKIIYLNNDEDTIRTPVDKLPNILTVVAKKY